MRLYFVLEFDITNVVVCVQGEVEFVRRIYTCASDNLSPRLSLQRPAIYATRRAHRYLPHSIGPAGRAPAIQGNLSS